MSYRPLWTCPRCGRTFANVNQTHTCAALGSVHAHFDGKDPAVRAAFERVLAALAPLGPVDVLAERSRIALHAWMSCSRRAATGWTDIWCWPTSRTSTVSKGGGRTRPAMCCTACD